MITGISIKNFKAIGDPGISLDLEPITLLFGTNGAGKSSIFHAFLYAYEVLINRNCDVDRTTLSGKNVDLGGFHSFVHDRDVTNPVVIEIDLDLSSAQLDREWPLAEELVGSDENTIDLSDLATDCQTARIGFEVKQFSPDKGPVLSKFYVNLDGINAVFFSYIRIDNSENRVNLVNVNYNHPIFHWPLDRDRMKQRSAGVFDHLYPVVCSRHDRKFWQDGEILPDFQDSQTDGLKGSSKYEKHFESLSKGKLNQSFGYFDESVIDDPNQYRFVQQDRWLDTIFWIYRYNAETAKVELKAAWFFLTGDAIEFYKRGPDEVADIEDKQEAEKTWESEQGELWNSPVPMLLDPTSLSNGSLPFFDQPLRLQIDNFGDKSEDEYDLKKTRKQVQNLISRVTIGPVKVLVEALKQFRHIGPLREIPPRSFHKILSPDSSRWCSGLAAWDKLSTENDDFVELVSEWLSSADRLGTGFSLIRKRYKEMESHGYLMNQLRGDYVLDALPDILELINELPEFEKLLLKNDQTNVEIEPPDIAVGLTQVIPVVVDAVDNRKGITLIEQPELHNHPSVEVGLGDLFFSAVRTEQKECRFLIETHGEHLVLRILRRFRQIAEGTLPKDMKAISPEQVAVYFLDSSADGTTLKRIHIGSNGDFIDKWPKGFFRERAEELF